MIYTTYYANLRNLPDTITPISISNSTPKGLLIMHLEAAVPFWTNVQQYKETGNWQAFKERYLVTLGFSGQDVYEALSCLTGDIALVCYEKDPSTCHRSILAEWLKEHYNLDVKEWGCDA